MKAHGLRKVLLVVPLLAVVAVWTIATSHARAEAAAASFEKCSVGAVLTPDPVLETGGDDMFISNCTYYNNAQHTQIVGQFGYDCCNNPVAWGRKSSFKECGGCFPCIPPPR
jgi:hypothetical protein